MVIEKKKIQIFNFQKPIVNLKKKIQLISYYWINN